MSLYRASYKRLGGEGKFTFSADNEIQAELWAWNFVMRLRQFWRDAKLQEVQPVVPAPVQEKLGL